jgi:hypothetical protein
MAFGVLSMIAVGVMLIAYGLLGPRASAAYNGPQQMDPAARAMFASESFMVPNDPEAVRFAYANGYRPAAQYGVGPYATGPYGTTPYGYGTYGAPQTIAMPVRTVQTVAAPAPQRVVTRTVERGPQRNWKKTALVIGGSTATGAGIGGLVGGKKGALIGAAIGGGASTLYESTK